MIRRGLCMMTLASASLVLCPSAAQACAACYGQSDSPMAAGMNWGIVSLLGMIVLVLGGVAGFFVFLIRRGAASAAAQPDGALAQSWAASWPVSAANATAAAPDPDSDPIEEAMPRGGLKPQSILARQRLHCAQRPTTSTTLRARHNRA